MKRLTTAVAIGSGVAVALTSLYVMLARDTSFHMPVLDGTCVVLVVGSGLPFLIRARGGIAAKVVAACASVVINSFVFIFFGIALLCQAFGNCP